MRSSVIGFPRAFAGTVAGPPRWPSLARLAFPAPSPFSSPIRVVWLHSGDNSPPGASMPRRLLLAVCAIAIVPCLFACGGDDDDASGPESTATSGLPVVANSTASPQLSGPAGKYSVSLDDIGAAWLTDIKGTFEINSPELVGLY